MCVCNEERLSARSAQNNNVNFASCECASGASKHEPVAMVRSLLYKSSRSRDSRPTDSKTFSDVVACGEGEGRWRRAFSGVLGFTR